MGSEPGERFAVQGLPVGTTSVDEGTDAENGENHLDPRNLAGKGAEADLSAYTDALLSKATIQIGSLAE